MTGTEKENDIIAFLNQHYLCESLTIKEIQVLLDYTESMDYAQHEIIADVGKVGNSLYFLIQGDAVFTYIDNGREKECARIHEGELIGEMSFFDQHPRSVRIRAAVSNTQVLSLSRKKYDRLKIEHPYIAVVLLEHAIISLEQLFRSVSADAESIAGYFTSPK